MSKIALYPGTFDPITLGHMDVIEAGSTIFDEVIVALLINPRKEPMFSEAERLLMIEESIKETGLTNVRALTFHGLTVDLAHREKAIAIMRGLRLVMDYEAELDISFNNRILANNVHTVFIPSTQAHIHIRSSTVRELLSFGAKDKLGLYVPKPVLRHLS